MEPNLQILSESKEVDEDRSWWKILLVGLIGLGASGGAFHYFINFIAEPGASDFWLFVSCFVLFLVIAILQVLFFKDLWKILLASAVQVLAPVFFFANEFSGPDANATRILILGFLVGYYFVFLGVRRGHRMVQNTIKLRFFEISRRTLPRVASGVLIVLSVVVYLSYFSWNLAPKDVGLLVTDGLLEGVKPFSNIIVPGGVIDPAGNMGDLIKSLALAKVQESKITVQDQNQSVSVAYGSLPPDYQAKVLNTVIGEMQSALQAKFSSFSSGETVGQFTYAVASDYFAKFSSFTGPFASILVVAILFFLAKGTLALFYWLIEFIAYVIFKALIVFGFAYVNLETRTREFLLLS